MLRTFLFLVITLRLLWPPGMCMCHLFSPEPAHHHDHDDHAPGCPASKSSAALVPIKQDPPRPPDAPDLTGALPDPGASTSPSFGALIAPPPDDAGPADRHVYLIVRALLI